MLDQEIDIRTRDGVMNTFVTHPEERGPHPVVLFFMDAPGKREELHDMARRIGTAGCYVMLPNLYYRSVREFDATDDLAGRGPFAYAMAGTFPERVAAAASIHGVRLHGEGSPQALAGNVRGELYFACAELDEFVPAGMVDDLEQHLSALDVHARVERYPGVHHGFVFPTRAGAYDKAACERHYERLFDLFGRNLQR